MVKYRYRYEGDRIHFGFPYSPDIIKEVKKFAGAYWENEFKEWIVPIIDEDELVDFIDKWGFEYVDITPKKAEQKIDYTPVDTSFVKGKLSMLNLPFLPRDYQLDTITYGLDKRRFINALDMGLGKTYCSIVTAELQQGFPCLIVTPASVKYQFAAEWERFTGRECAVIETKETKKRKNNWNADVVVINYDILGKMIENGKIDKNTGKPKKSIQLRFNELADIKWKSCIFDEAHFLKNSKTARSKASAKVIKPIEFRQFLTGTPVASKPKDIVNLLKLLGRFEDVSPGGWTSFVRTYCGAKYEFGRLNTDGASNTVQLNQKLRDNCYIRYEKREVLEELPDITKTIIETPFSNNREYNKALNNLYDYMMEKGGVEAANKSVDAHTLVLIGVLRKLSIEAKMKFIEQYIKDWLEGDEKLVVFGVHRDPLISLHKKFGGGLIVGGVSSKKKYETIQKFNESEERLCFVNIKAGGTGTDGLQNNCSNAIFIEPPWSPDDLEQAISRLDRSGQKFATNIGMLLNMEGVDGYIWDDILVPKSEIANAVNKGIDVSLDKDGMNKIAKKLFKNLQIGK